jgi:hypothetical protein
MPPNVVFVVFGGVFAVSRVSATGSFHRAEKGAIQLSLWRLQVFVLCQLCVFILVFYPLPDEYRRAIH